MADFNVETYRAKLNKLAEQIRLMNVAINNMHYECGTGGISERATFHLGELVSALEMAYEQKDDLTEIMIAETS